MVDADASISDHRFVDLTNSRHICAFGAGMHRAIARATGGDMSADFNRCELDSHADTCVAGSNMILISDPRTTVSVHGFSKERDSIKNIPVGTAATLYQDPETSKIYCLIFHETLYFGDRLGSASLLCTNQLRYNGLTVDDVPKHLDQSGRSSHSILISDPQLTVPLTLEGVISGFHTRKPDSIEECQMYPQVVMTSPVIWEPSSSQHAENER